MAVHELFAKRRLTLLCRQGSEWTKENPMPFVIAFPHINPEIFSFDVFGAHLALRWYALAYIVGLLLAWRIIMQLMKRDDLWPNKAPMEPAKAEDLLTWLVLGVIIGGRLGFVLFYQPSYYFANPGDILKVWQGGMAFHGGFLGVVVAGALYAWRYKLPVLSLGDALAIATPTGLFLGRLANFIKPELWGRPTNVPWAMYFPDPVAEVCPDYWLLPCTRHPSQLYEAALEGIVLGVLLFWLAYRRGALKVPGRSIAVFFTGYGSARFFIEYFRQADAQFVSLDNPFGYVIHIGETGITQGQILSLPMIVVGLALLIWTKKRA